MDWPSGKDYLKLRTSLETTSIYRPINGVKFNLQNKGYDTNTNCMLFIETPETIVYTFTPLVDVT